ncbi:MAG TPA: NUDIX hydrolase [Thermoanaerobaculia bacterium]|jgi:ADP-ribose pyrophosphatase|nr:NUDIX hydrolase [Thermoanaerobaculia bacterium]
MSQRKGGERLGTREIYKGRTIHVAVDTVRLPNDKQMDMELVHHKGAVAVVPVIGDDVLLIRQYRYATGGWLLEVPAGKLEPDEKPEACALRETEEETGYRPAELEPLGWIWTTPGFCDEKIWLFLARGLEETRQELDEDEVLELERIPLKEAVDKAARGEIHDGKTAVALLRAGQRLFL